MRSRKSSSIRATNSIFGTAAGEVITTQITATQIFGMGAPTRSSGRAAMSFIDGGSGFDTLHGGKGSDTFHLYDATLSGDFDLVIEAANGGRDTCMSARMLTIPTFSTATR